MHGTVPETDEYGTKHEKTGRRKNGATRLNVKTNTDLSLPIFPNFPLFILTSLKLKGQSLISESHQALGKNRHINGGLTVIKDSWVDNAYG